MMRRYIFCLIVVCSLADQARGQGVTFNASVDKNRVAMGEQFGMTFTLEGATGGKNFRPPAFTDFLPLSGPNQSTQMNYVNGVMSSSVAYSYILQPRAEGKFTIGPATIEAGGKQLQTQPVVIDVVKGSAQPKQQAQQQANADIGKQIGDNLFLKAEVDRSRVYQGEQITVVYKIYTRVSIANYNLTRIPALTGFWSEDLDVPRQIQLTREVVNGKQYNVGILRKVAIFPQRSGAMELDPMEVTCAVQVQNRRRSNDFFDQFFNDPFGSTNVNHKVASPPVKITVLPLPSENIPPAFNGAVGKFTMESWLDKRQTKTNEPVTLKIKISGHGNLKLLQAPSLNLTSDIEKYDPKISDNITKDGDRIGGSRIFEYLLIPRHAGDQKIPSFTFSFFDSEKKNYSTLNSPEFTLNVEKGNEVTSAPIAGLSKEDVKLLGEDIRFIKSGNISLHQRGENFVGSAGFYLLAVTPVLAFIVFIFFQRRRERTLGDIAGLRYRKARTMAKKRLAAAKGFLEQKKKEEFYAEISRALWGYVGDKLGIAPAGLSLDSIRASLEARGVLPEVVATLSGTLEHCEFARFAPSADSLEMDSMYNKAVELISTIEGQLR